MLIRLFGTRTCSATYLRVFDESETFVSNKEGDKTRLYLKEESSVLSAQNTSMLIQGNSPSDCKKREGVGDRASERPFCFGQSSTC